MPACLTVALLVQGLVITAANPIVDRLNRQYALSKPSNNWTDAGVLAHVLDWVPPQKPWLPCSSDGSQPWCTNWSDWISTSMISPAKCTSNKCLYGGGGTRSPYGGLIYSTDALHDAVLCAWAGDGDTSDRLCSPPGNSSSCIPGCYGLKSSPDKGKPIWCSTPPTTNFCPHRPSQLSAMMKMWISVGGPFNEVVIDAAIFRARVPQAIEMFFIPVECSDECKAKVQSYVSTTRSALSMSAAQLPLVSLDLSNQTAPFTCVSCA